MRLIAAGITTLILLCLVQSISAALTFRGNPIIERNGDPLYNSTREQRIWIDDFQPQTWLTCCFLHSYQVYIHSALPNSGDPVWLQIWTNTSIINNYTLKWQTLLSGYTPGRAYEIVVPQGQIIETSEYDRIGFSTTGPYPPVAYNSEIDDYALMATAHRTYWTFLQRWGITLPQVGDARYMDNFALRGMFSMGVVIDNQPPKTATQQYIGYDLKVRDSVVGAGDEGSQGLQTAYVDSTPLVTGKLVQFVYKVAATSTATTLHLVIWVPNMSQGTAKVVYVKSINLSPGPAQPTAVVSITDGPMVNSSCTMGWMFSGYNPLYYSFNATAQTFQVSGRSGALQAQAVYSLNMPWPSTYSIGVVIDQASSSGSWAGGYNSGMALRQVASEQGSTGGASRKGDGLTGLNLLQALLCGVVIGWRALN